MQPPGDSNPGASISKSGTTTWPPGTTRPCPTKIRGAHQKNATRREPCPSAVPASAGHRDGDIGKLQGEGGAPAGPIAVHAQGTVHLLRRDGTGVQTEAVSLL